MALLEPVVLADVVQVVASDHNRALHFRRDHNSPEQVINLIDRRLGRWKVRLIINNLQKSEQRKQDHTTTQIDTYLRILPRMLTSPVKGHFLST